MERIFGMIISERIFKIIKDKGISQKDFSIETGISQSTISDWKTKGTNPSADKIMTICRFLKISPYELLQDTFDPDQDIDYMILSEGTDAYNLVIEFNDMDRAEKDRLLGYAEALKK